MHFVSRSWCRQCRALGHPTIGWMLFSDPSADHDTDEADWTPKGVVAPIGLRGVLGPYGKSA